MSYHRFREWKKKVVDRNSRLTFGVGNVKSMSKDINLVSCKYGLDHEHGSGGLSDSWDVVGQR